MLQRIVEGSVKPRFAAVLPLPVPRCLDMHIHHCPSAIRLAKTHAESARQIHVSVIGPLQSAIRGARVTSQRALAEVDAATDRVLEARCAAAAAAEVYGRELFMWRRQPLPTASADLAKHATATALRVAACECAAALREANAATDAMNKKRVPALLAELESSEAQQVETNKPDYSEGIQTRLLGTQARRLRAVQAAFAAFAAPPCSACLPPSDAEALAQASRSMSVRRDLAAFAASHAPEAEGATQESGRLDAPRFCAELAALGLPSALEAAAEAPAETSVAAVLGQRSARAMKSTRSPPVYG